MSHTFSAKDILKTVLILVLTYLLFIIIKPFVAPLVVAGIFAIVFNPFFRKLKNLKINKTVSALIVVGVTLFFIIIPVLSLIGLIANEAIEFTKSININEIQKVISEINTLEFINYEISLEKVQNSLINNLQNIGTFVSSKSLNALSTIGNSILLFFVYLILYFYLLRDSEEILKEIRKISPFGKKETNKIINVSNEIIKTIFHGNLLSALTAGGIAYIGLRLAHVPSPIIWALLAGIFSLIPTMGTLFVYIITIFITWIGLGYSSALFLLGYFLIVEILLRENIIKPWLLDDRLKFHPILIFFALVGGVTAFGSIGLFYGPIIIAFMEVVYQSYKTIK